MVKTLPCNAGDTGLIPGRGRSEGGAGELGSVERELLWVAVGPARGFCP